MSIPLRTVSLALVLLGSLALAPPPRTCSLHGTALAEVEVPVAYGLLPRFEAVEKARWKLFPHSDTFVAGGCVVGEEATLPVKQRATCVVALEAFKEGFDKGRQSAKAKFEPKPKASTTTGFKPQEFEDK